MHAILRFVAALAAFMSITQVSATEYEMASRPDVVYAEHDGTKLAGDLYLPKGRKFPLPGVVGTCGHSDNGKAAEAYQSFAQGLARMGYVVLIFDPLGQGERAQYRDPRLKPGRGGSVAGQSRFAKRRQRIFQFTGRENAVGDRV